MRTDARAVLAALPVAALLAAGCSSAPSGPAWCAPLVAQFHAKESRAAYLSGLAAVQKQGAPVGKLITDEAAYTANQAAASSLGTAGFAAVADAPKVIAKVSADLKSLNGQCGQPADAYKSDNA